MAAEIGPGRQPAPGPFRPGETTEEAVRAITMLRQTAARVGGTARAAVEQQVRPIDPKAPGEHRPIVNFNLEALGRQPQPIRESQERRSA